MNTSIDPLPFTLKADLSPHWSDHLTSAIIKALVQGKIKPGDSFPSPAELTKTYAGHRQDILNSITQLLADNILQQDPCGNLRIHPEAAPSTEMKQQALLTRTRHLVREPRKWNLPTERVRLIFREINS